MSKFGEIVPPGNALHEAIYRINIGHDITTELAYDALSYALNIDDEVNRGVCLGIILNGIVSKKPQVGEIIGILKAILNFEGIDISKLKRLEMPNKAKVIGYAGSGKKGIKTINVSSGAAIVASACGVYVAKSCSCSTSSASGSADFIESVGAKIDLSPDQMIEVLKKTKLGFFKIENMIPRFDKVYGGHFYAPNALSFGLAGILLPFKPDNLFYGLAHPNIQLLINVLKELNYEYAFGVSTADDGIHFLDEVGIFGTTTVVGIQNSIIGRILALSVSHKLNLPHYDRLAISPGATKSENILLTLEALRGKGNPAYQDFICVNAGTLLCLDGKVNDLTEGYATAKEAINSGGAINNLKEFISATGGNIGLIDHI